MWIYYSPKFEREYRKLSKEVKISAEKKGGIFRKNPFNPRLSRDV